VDVDAVLGGLYELIAPHLTEKQRRLLAGAAAGRWVVVVARGWPGSAGCLARRCTPACGNWATRPTRAAASAAPVADPSGWPSTSRACCKHWTSWSIPTRAGTRVAAALDLQVDPPARRCAWRAGFQVSDDTVGRLLKQQRYTLQRTLKTEEGAQHEDRDAQFRYVNQQAKQQLADRQPVVSVDTKKKELVGRYANGGAEWQPAGEPERVNVHDFPDEELGKAIPYGVYDLGANAGWVSVGCDHDTAAFAVATLRRWWQQASRVLYPQATRLLVTADAGGSNGYRVRAWKTQLARLAAETGLAVTVCHFPPGTSKWNKVEHRLFSHISTNWRGRPLVSHQVIVELIAATTTRSGLKVRAELDQGRYPLGVKVSDGELAAVPLQRHDWHGE
jgi:Rhodopirellula transposase DDE domain